MDKYTNYFGIDISKDVFDITNSKGDHFQFANTAIGFSKFLKLLNTSSHCVMEATGYYHYRLAYFLEENSVRVSVVNPLSIKRFIQMKLSKVKTDKSDSKMICLYAEKEDLKLWKGHSKKQQICLQITRLLSVYIKQTTMLKNKIKGEQVLGTPSKVVFRSLNRSLKNLQKEMKKIEDELIRLIKENYQDLLTRLETIPGIGRKTSLLLIILTDGFERFDSASELCSYAGLTPIIKQSGTSVHGRARISKIGNRKLRNLLFMCSFNACKHNKACKSIYDRIVAKGKSKKLALMAVCNKLLKQSFAIAKSGLIYDENYKSILIRET